MDSVTSKLVYARIKCLYTTEESMTVIRDKLWVILAISTALTNHVRQITGCSYLNTILKLMHNSFET